MCARLKYQTILNFVLFQLIGNSLLVIVEFGVELKKSYSLKHSTTFIETILQNILKCLTNHTE